MTDPPDTAWDKMPAQRQSKPAWADVPASVRGSIEDIVGAPVVDASVAWGGYGPSATFLLTAEGGRRFFCKGTHPGYTEQGVAAFTREAELYKGLPELSRFGPGFHGAVEDGEWHLMVLDIVEGGPAVPPWTVKAFRAAIGTVARFHADLPEGSSKVLLEAEAAPLSEDLYRPKLGWGSLAKSEAAKQAFTGLFAVPRRARQWLDQYVAELAGFEGEAWHIDGRRSWVHHDLRSDNMVFAAEEDVRLVDWPFLAYGPVVMDLAFFLPSVQAEGGPPPEIGIGLYEMESGAQFDKWELSVAVATVAGYFAARADLEDVPALPRLRWIQRRQLFPALGWISRLLKIDPPPAPRRQRPLWSPSVGAP
jgi:hypothetical protein